MNEVRLIDANAYAAEMKVRQDACKEMIDAAVKNDNWELYDKLSRSFGVFVEAKLTLDNMPTVDAVPVRHGEWLRTDAFPHRIYCSVCYKTYVPNDRWQIWVDDELPKNYCPNCGAKMDGADGERKTE